VGVIVFASGAGVYRRAHERESEVDEIVLLYTTWPDAASAEAFARKAVAEGLVACANISRATRAVYRLEERVETADEVTAIFKTTAAAVPAFHRRLLETHPYETPCMLATRVDRSLSDPAYATWLETAIFHAGTRA
jgi:periplasmic divalent cation tolerance protein